MCDTIVEADFLTIEGRKPTAEEIFNYSPTGELSEVFNWYYTALYYKRGDGTITPDQLAHLEQLEKTYE